MVRKQKTSLTRRAFLVGGTIIGTATVLGVGMLSTIDTAGLQNAVKDDGSTQLTAWVEFRTNGETVIYVPRTEMGQGIYTGMAQLLAEELELDLNAPNVKVDFPDEAKAAYSNFYLVTQKREEDRGGAGDWLTQRVFALVGPIVTGGSTSIIDGFTPLRKAGASAREMFENAAAKRWKISKDAVYADAGFIYEKSGNRKLSYNELAADAAKETPNADPKTKSRAEWKQIGKSQPRLDIPAKTRGEAIFGVDILPQNGEDLLIATIKRCPAFGGSVTSYNDKAARAVKGYAATHNLGYAIAVVADTYYAAKKALDLVEIDWVNPDYIPSSADIEAELERSLNEDAPNTNLSIGDVAPLLAERTDLDVTYTTPHLAHATMEPQNATAIITPEKGEIWAPTQAPGFVREAIAASKHAPKEVAVHTTLAGGGFGRRSDADYARDIVAIADEHPGKMVKLIWSREEDTQHDFYRPASRTRVRASLGADGMPTAFEYRIACQSIGDDFSTRNGVPVSQGGPGEPAKVDGVTHEFPYAIANRITGSTHVTFPIPVGYWRSVGHSNNGYVVESAIDELAVIAGKDPMDYRASLTKGHERWEPLVKTLRTASNWDTPLAADPQGGKRGAGVSLCESFGSYVGEMAEITVRGHEIKIDRITCVVDAGTIVNPNSVEAQMEGAIMYALTAVLTGKVTLEDGAVQEGNFDSYPIVTLAQAPEIKVVMMENDQPPGGAGEPGTPPLFAAITNAIFAATGKRIRSLPLSDHGFYVA